MLAEVWTPRELSKHNRGWVERFVHSLVAFLVAFLVIITHTVETSAGAPGIDAFTRHGAGVRAVGMGKAATSIPMGASSFYWNPAGVGLVEGTEITSLFSQPYNTVDDLQYHTVGFAHRGSDMHFGYGLSGIYFDAGKLREADAAGALTGKTFGSRDGALYFTTGAGFGGDADGRKRGAIGVNFKAVRGEIADFSSTGFGSDIGFLFLPAEWARMGVMIENLIAPTFHFKSIDEKFPLRIRGGAGIDPFNWMTLSIDYAYSTHDELGQTHRVGLNLRIK